MGTHKTLVNGTAFAVTGGTELINGTICKNGGGRTLVNGTEFEVKFGQSEYTITLTGSGGTIRYKNVNQTGTFIVKAGDSVTILATAFCMTPKYSQNAVIRLNGVTVSTETANQTYETVTATYTYTPEQDTKISRSTTDPGSGRVTQYSTTINIETQ